MSSSGSGTASNTSSGVASNTPIVEDPNKTLWAYVLREEIVDKAGGNLLWKCKFCDKQFKSSYTRVKAHLLRIPNSGIGSCTKVSKKAQLEMERLEEEVVERSKGKVPRTVPLPPSGIDSQKKRKGGSGNALKDSFNMTERETLDNEIARMFYSAGLPFNLAKNPYFRSAFTYAANHNLAGYVPPGYNKLRTSLLTREKNNIEKLCAPIRATWKDKGVSIVSDGWSDSQRRPLINVIVVSDSNPMFLKAVDCSGERKDKFFIANLLKEAINEVGHENVVQVVTDNAPNCKAAGQLIEQQFSKIVWTPCVVHTLNLALKNICEAKNVDSNANVFDHCFWITDVVQDVIFVKNFITNHSMRLAMYNDIVNLKLLSVVETCFASAIVMLKRFKLIKSGLQSLVISEKWNLYREDDVEKAKSVKDKLLDDFWWGQVDYILSFTSPIYDMLRLCDTDKPTLHLVYDMWDTMIEKVKKAIYLHEVKRLNEESSFFEVIRAILVDRWNKNNTPLHCLAHSLNSRYYTDEWLGEDSSRLPPHKDNEINKERMKCLKKYFPLMEDRLKVNNEYVSFIEMKGDFGDFDVIASRYYMDPKAWWYNFGSSAPMLQSIALKLLAQPSSSSCAERNWSIYGFIHSAKRNKMTPQRAEDLVFIHSNLRLLSRKSPQYEEGESKMWDLGGGGDEHDTFEDVGVLEFANLSLDEPELEAEVILDIDDSCDVINED